MQPPSPTILDSTDVKAMGPDALLDYGVRLSMDRAGVASEFTVQGLEALERRIVDLDTSWMRRRTAMAISRVRKMMDGQLLAQIRLVEKTKAAAAAMKNSQRPGWI